MNPLILILLAAFVASPVHAEPKKKKSWFEEMFQPKKPKVAPKRIKKTRAKSQPLPTPTAIPKSKRIPVDQQWYANYLEQEAAWDYEIPDDALIEFKDGKYHVPPVVFRHYEDMLATPRRSPTPKPTARPAIIDAQ